MIGLKSPKKHIWAGAAPSYSYPCVCGCFPLLVTVFIKLVLCARNFDVISAEAYDRSDIWQENKKPWK